MVLYSGLKVAIVLPQKPVKYSGDLIKRLPIGSLFLCVKHIGMRPAKSSLDNTYYLGNMITPVAMELEGL